MYTVGSAGDGGILEGYSTCSVAVTEAVATNYGTALDKNVLSADVTCSGGSVINTDVLNGRAVSSNAELTVEVNSTLTNYGDILVNGDALSVITCKDGNSVTCHSSSECLVDSKIISIVDLSLCFVHVFFKNTLYVFSTCNGQSDVIHTNTGGLLVDSQRELAVVNNGGVGAELIVSKYAALDRAIHKVKRCTVSALDPDFNTVYITANCTVGSSAARSGNQHTCALSVDRYIFHGTDNVFSCVAAVVRFDTVGKSRTLNGYVLNAIYSCSRFGLKYDTANGLVSIALALYVNNKVFKCNSIPYLDCRGVACMNNSTILNGRIVLNAHTAISVTSSKSISAKIKRDRLFNLELICTVVNISSHDNDVTIYHITKSCIQLSLSSNREDILS